MPNDTITITRVELNNILTEVGRKACKLTLETYRSIGLMAPNGSADKLLISSIASIAAITVSKTNAITTTQEIPDQRNYPFKHAFEVAGIGSKTPEAVQETQGARPAAEKDTHNPKKA